MGLTFLSMPHAATRVMINRHEDDSDLAVLIETKIAEKFRLTLELGSFDSDKASHLQRESVLMADHSFKLQVAFWKCHIKDRTPG